MDVGRSLQTSELLPNAVDDNISKFNGIKTLATMDYHQFSEIDKDQGRLCNGQKLLSDQFGMSALACVLHHIYGSEEDNAVRLLMLGLSCAKLGMERDNLVEWYPTFGGPWATAPCKARDLDVKVPSEYLTNVMIRGKLPNIRLNNLSEDTLFFLFYNFPGEVYQRAAACELFNRNWRYHKTTRVWLTRTKPGELRVQTSTYEVGTYSVFDHVQWRKMQTQMTVEYQDLEERPQLPEAMQAYCSQVVSHNVYQNSS